MLLNAAFAHDAGRCAAYVVLRLWAGLRESEMSRLDLRDIDLENEVVRVNSLPRARLVKLNSNATKMLRELQDRGMLTAETLHPSKAAIDHVYQKAGVKSRRNALRHTAMIYHYTNSGDINETAQWAGHSGLVMEHIYNPIRLEDAELFWNILPTDLR